MAFAVFASAASAATVALPGGAATAVREYGGTIVFSEWVQRAAPYLERARGGRSAAQARGRAEPGAVRR